MTKHTPGPWRVEPWRYENGKRTVLTVQTATDAIAQVLDLWCPDDRKAESEANARLIAAAPELLEALKEQSALLEWAYTQIINLKKPQIQRLIQEQAEHSIGRKFDGYLPASKRARAAIAKAEGGAS